MNTEVTIYENDPNAIFDGLDWNAVGDNDVFATSRDVAKAFGKRHDNVLRDIRIKAKHVPNFATTHFTDTYYVHPQNGQTYFYVEMTRSGFAMLVMGFSGRKAGRFIEAFIKRFNQMDELIKSRQTASFSSSYVDALRHSAEKEEQRGLSIDINDPVALISAIEAYKNAQIEC